MARRRLPHWRQIGVAYFITFRLQDSVPQTLLRQWRDERTIWLRWQPPPWPWNGCLLNPLTQCKVRQSQDCLRHEVKYPKALSPSSRPPFARQRNREASPLSRPRVDDAVPHRAVRPRPLLSEDNFHLSRRFELLACAAANARRLLERSVPAGDRTATYRACHSRARSGVSPPAESLRCCRS